MIDSLCAQTNLKAILSMVPETATALVKGVLRNAHGSDDASQLLALEFYKHLRPIALWSRPCCCVCAS